MQYVQSQTAHYGTVFNKKNTLTKVRLNSKEREEEEAYKQAQHHSSDTDLVFLKNRTTHTNRVNGDFYSLA